MRSKFWLSGLIATLLLASLTPLAMARPLTLGSSYGGAYAGWPTVWTPISSLNDPDDALAIERIDLVGDATDPGVYYAGDANYLYFRIRVDDGAATEFGDTISIVIDYDRNGSIDYGFAWDTQSADQTKHGLELQVLSTLGGTWKTTRMGDIDGASADKTAPPDFGLATGDGYVRMLNGQNTTNFGTTTFVDFAIKWDFIIAQTDMDKNQTWNIQVGTIDNANDHNFLRYDVAGSQTPDSVPSMPGSAGFTPTLVTLEKLSAAAQKLPLNRLIIPALAALLGVALFLRRR